MTSTSAANNKIAPISLLEILKDIENQNLTAQKAIENCFDRIAEFDGTIKAFTCLNPRADEQTASAKGPLAGIGIAVKDIIDSADLPTEYHSPIYKDHQPAADASCLAIARAAGSTLIGKTVTTEFAFFQPGPTCNPHNPDHTPGGSSSGSAAAVAAGMAPLALGTQTGGSVIRPAAFCGVTGFKPSAGLLPKVGMKTFSWSLDTMGLFTATVADAAYATSILTGRNMRIDQSRHFSNPTLGIMRTHNWPEANPEYRQKFEDLLASLGKFGIKLKEIAVSDEYIAAFHAHQAIQDFEARQALCWEYETHPDKLSPLLKETLDFATTLKPSDYDEARVTAEVASQKMDEAFEEVDALISLSAPGPAPLGLGSTGSSIFNRVWTLFGLPCVNVTGLTSDDSLPLGIQVIGPYFSDHATLTIADWLERAIQRHLLS